MDSIKHQQNVLKQLDSILKSYHSTSIDKEETPNEQVSKRFQDTFFISSVTGQGIIPLKEYILNCASPGKWRFPEDFTNDMDILELISEFIRAQLLSHFYQEVPHAVVQLNERLDTRDDGSLYIKQVLLCPYGSVMQRMRVSEGKVLKSVEIKAAKQLSIAFQTDVNLEINLRVHKFKKND
ncbi:GTPase Era, mitochondrial [Oopsacas minuta]|uniref:GTPase Era, mitochondrial n=1 Tax=Oopsacas minuta TaxID=111878 RepID=A0AAV7K9Y3_9METZ|nr:GTPase Era, mitochondrial [Oopsacas minuta]